MATATGLSRPKALEALTRVLGRAALDADLETGYGDLLLDSLDRVEFVTLLLGPRLSSEEALEAARCPTPSETLDLLRSRRSHELPPGDVHV